MVKIAYQLYSARDAAEKDLGKVLREIAALGYEGVEFAGFHGRSADEVAALLDESGLEAVSSHVPFEDILKDPFGVIAYHLAIGCAHIAVPYLTEEWRPGSPGFAPFIAEIHRFARLCREAGIPLLYHNHDFEFVRLSGLYALDFLFRSVPASLLQTEIDTCWVRYSGLDPAGYIEKYAGRCPVVHVKDYACDGPTGPCAERPESFAFRPVGGGVLDVPAVVRTAVAAGAKWLVAEQDEPFITPMADAKASLAALRAALSRPATAPGP